MTIPNSGALALSAIQTEFGGTNPISLSEYYAGGSFVPGGTSGINGAVPSSSTIAMSKFYGTASFVARGFFTREGGGSLTLNYINIATTGDGTTFGGTASNLINMEAVSSTTRGVYVHDAGMYYTTLGTGSSFTFFGDDNAYTGQGAELMGCCGSQTRGLIFGGRNDVDDAINAIRYITIATLGSSVTFGVLLFATELLYGCASTTRGLMASIFNGSNGAGINYVTIATTGNALAFGNLTVERVSCGSGSGSTRGIMTGGGGTVPHKSSCDYVTIATTGNATSFGNLIAGRQDHDSASSKLRLVVAQGSTTGFVDLNNMEYFTIATTGNATAFGNLVNNHYSNANGGISNDHGGL